MVQSVHIASDDLISFEIRVSGKPVPDTMALTEIEVDLSLNRIPRATIKIVDGSKSDEVFSISEEDDLLPGNKVEILLGYHGGGESVFNGIITRHGLEIGGTGNANLVLHCADPAIRLTTRQDSVQFSDVSDSDMMVSLITGAGLTADVADTQATASYTMKPVGSDWDYILHRASANGLVVNVADGKLSIHSPVFSAPVFAANYGDSIEVLSLDLDGTHQVSGLEAKAWDPVKQELIRDTAEEPSLNDQGNVSAKILADGMTFDVAKLTNAAQTDPDELGVWANAELLRARLSRIRGRLRVPGQAKLRPGTTLAIGGLGARFNGDGYVSGVRHMVIAGVWSSEVQLGLSQDLMGNREPERAFLTSVQRPPVQGLQIAKVLQMHGDPDGQFRIKVYLPLLDAGDDGFWVRMMHPYASGSAGIMFLPEVGDEVVLAFLNDDPNAAILLGALHSSKLPQPQPSEEANPTKMILTATQLKILLNDADKEIEVQTPGGQHLLLSDKDGKIEMTDTTGNKVVLDDKGIALSSPADISLSASGKIDIKGDAGVVISSAQDIETSGLNVSTSADAAASVKGGASAELKASGQTTIKGALVSIN